MKHQQIVRYMRGSIMTFKIVEKFISINGEGERSGELAVFIRLAGCNLNCTYCDTLWANDENAVYSEMTAQEVYDYIHSTGVQNVTLTGGEPLLHENIKLLIEKITQDVTLHLEIETNGSVDISPFKDKRLQNLSFTLDYKSPSSGMEAFMYLKNFGVIEPRDTVKFVVGSMNDLEKAREIIEEYQLTDRCQVILSPVYGDIDMNDIVEYMKVNVMNQVKLQVQLHKVIWHPERKGV